MTEGWWARDTLAVVLGLFIVMAPAVGDASPSSVPQTVDAGGGAADGVIWANVQFSRPPVDGGSDDGANSCRWTPATVHDAGIGDEGDIIRWVAGVLQRLFARSCDGATAVVWVSQPTGEQLGRAARDVVIGLLPSPTPRTAPPSDRAIVHANVWFWTESSVWRTVSVTAWVPTPDGPVWATTTATPTDLVLSSGEPYAPTIRCEGPGRVWRPSDGDVAMSACSTTYHHDSAWLPSGRFPAVLGIDWVITWTSNAERGGVLPGHRTTVDVPMVVSEIQALVVAD